jgi:hypothetical protein
VSTPARYVPYTRELEQPFPNEAELVRQVVTAMEHANQQVAAKHRHGLRDAHAKSHGVLAGELRVEPNLPEHLAQGLLAAPRTYAVIVRLSTAPGDLRSDQLPVQRGMAIKVLDVHGPRALKDGFSTQDFLLVNHPTLPFGTIGEYAELQQLLERQPRQSDQQLQLAGLGARIAARLLTRIERALPAQIETLAAANHHILGETFHSMAAIRYGDYVAKISAAPRSQNVRALTGKPIDRRAGESALRDLVVDFFTHNSAESRPVRPAVHRHRPDAGRGRIRVIASRTLTCTRPPPSCTCPPRTPTATPGAATPTTSSRSTPGTRSKPTVRSARSCAPADPHTHDQAISATPSTASSITNPPALTSYPPDHPPGEDSLTPHPPEPPARAPMPACAPAQAAHRACAATPRPPRHRSSPSRCPD